MAEGFFYNAHEYSFLKVEKDLEKSRDYLRRATVHCAGSERSHYCHRLAQNFISDGRSDTIESTKYFGLAELYLDTCINIDGLKPYLVQEYIYMYELSGDLNKALKYIEASDNPSDFINAAQWIFDGKIKGKGKVEALELLMKRAQFEKETEYPMYDMTKSVRFALNMWVHCDGFLSKKEIEPYYLEGNFCP